MANWPEKFCPLINSLQETPPNNSISSQMDVGPAKVRRRTTANTRSLAFRIFVKNADMEEFDDFYNVITYSGSDPFDFIHPRTKEAVQARFTSVPAYQERGGVGYEVSIALEVLP